MNKTKSFIQYLDNDIRIEVKITLTGSFQSKSKIHFKPEKRKYYQDNKEKILKKQKIYRKNNMDIIRARNRKYYKNNKGKIYVKNRNWLKNNPEFYEQYVKEYSKKWYGKNKLHVRNVAKKWNRSPPGKVSRQKSRHKRQRNLGFIPLNEWFPNSHAHHIDKEHIIYIPKEIHDKIYHNSYTGQGMVEINKIAIHYIMVG